MANGFTKDGGVQEQIDATVTDAVNRVRSHLNHEHNDTEYCLECGELIPQTRRNIFPGVDFCVTCQEKEDAKEKVFSAYNRRGSKDSQLR